MDAVVAGTDEGELLETETRRLRIKVSRAELDVLEYEADAGYEGPHSYKRHVNSFYVLEGELEFTVDGEKVRAGPGTLVSVPPGVVHAFTNPGPGGVRFLNVHAPECGFTELMRARDRGEDVDPTDYDIWEE